MSEPAASTPVPNMAQFNDPVDHELVVRQVTPDIITFSKPFTRAGLFAIGGRSTAVKLPNNDVFLYVSTPHSPATAATIAKMGGPVKYLVTPDGEHGMYMEEYTKAYPEAKAIGVKRYKESKPNIKWAGLFGAGGETQQYGFEPTITLINISSHLNDELMAVHHPSKTLIEADMLFNLPPTEQYSRVGGVGIFNKLMGSGKFMSPDSSFHSTITARIVSNKETMKKELAAVNKLDWDRIIPCHGDVIESNGKVAWNKVWGKYS